MIQKVRQTDCNIEGAFFEFEIKNISNSDEVRY